jgi:DNA helicase-2/ATP-dependent DNA helicase PcrA
MDFTEEQLRIIKHRSGHARVSAVAGSGKTTTMVARVAHLLEQGVEPDSMLILMFNKSARDCFAESMQQRLTGSGLKFPEVRTFHSLGNRLVESFTRRGVLPSFRLVTEEYVQERLARQVAAESARVEGTGESYLAQEEVEDFLTFIDLVKATTASAAEVFTSQDLAPRYGYFISAFKLFEKARRQQGMRFFADLIHEPLMAMQENTQLRNWVSNRVSHIIVDEYQDINESQQQLLKILAGQRAQVMVVGDVDQCIYEWRGARPEYITDRFQLDFSDPVNYLLSYTFRYGHTLSLAANHLIAKNRKRDKKLCISHPENGYTSISCYDAERASDIVQYLQDWLADGRLLSEAVVLVRLYAQSVAVELALLEAGIPYRLVGNAQVFECQEILGLTGYLRLIDGSLGQMTPDEREKLVAAMLSQPHLGIKREEMQSLVQQLSLDPLQGAQILAAWSENELPPFIKKRCEEAAANWQTLIDLSPHVPAAGLLKKVVTDLKLYDFYHKFSARKATAENRVKTCEAFIDFAAAQKLSVEGLFEKMAELRLADGEIASDTLLITSIHRAKGLEWPLVLLPGLEDGSFPLYTEQHSVLECLEDERRLFYVAITRARERLVCIHAVDGGLKKNIQQKSDALPDRIVRASRFLYEANIGLSRRLGELLSEKVESQKIVARSVGVARSYLQRIGRKIELHVLPGAEEKEQSRSRILSISEIEEGMQVLHPVFGSGEVCAIKDRKQGRLEVEFKEHGRTVLLLAYAKLEAVS